MLKIILIALPVIIVLFLIVVGGQFEQGLANLKSVTGVVTAK